MKPTLEEAEEKAPIGTIIGVPGNPNVKVEVLGGYRYRYDDDSTIEFTGKRSTDTEASEGFILYDDDGYRPIISVPCLYEIFN